MTIELYRKAVKLLEDSGELGPLRFPASSDDINGLEERLGTPLPESYKAMLEDFGIMMFLDDPVISTPEPSPPKVQLVQYGFGGRSRAWGNRGDGKR